MKKIYIYAIFGLLSSNLGHSALVDLGAEEFGGVLSPHRAANRLNIAAGDAEKSPTKRKPHSPSGASGGILSQSKGNPPKKEKVSLFDHTAVGTPRASLSSVSGFTMRVLDELDSDKENVSGGEKDKGLHLKVARFEAVVSLGTSQPSSPQIIDTRQEELDKVAASLSDVESDAEEQGRPSAAMVVFDGRSIIPAVSRSGRGGGQMVAYLGTIVPTPRTFRAIGVDDHVRFLKEQMERRLNEMGVKNLQGVSSARASGSSLFYSERYNITFLMTADLAQIKLFEGWDLTQSARGDKEKAMVNRFISDLIETTSTPSAEVSSVGQLKRYIKPEVVQQAARDKSLSLFLNVFYRGNKDFFEGSLDDLDPDSAFKEDLRSKLKDGYNEEKADREIYQRLVERQIFSTLLREKYARNLQVHIDVYQAVLGWQDLHRSLMLTCKVGSIGDASYGEEFCSAFIYPFLDLLLIDPDETYDCRSSFYNNNVQGLKENEGRFHVVKFKAPSGVVPAMALFGSKRNLSSLEAAVGDGRSKMLMAPESKPAERTGSGCAVM